VSTGDSGNNPAQLAPVVLSMVHVSVIRSPFTSPVSWPDAAHTPDVPGRWNDIAPSNDVGRAKPLNAPVH
jgi:hypothetical protein